MLDRSGAIRQRRAPDLIGKWAKWVKLHHDTVGKYREQAPNGDGIHKEPVPTNVKDERLRNLHHRENYRGAGRPTIEYLPTIEQAIRSEGPKKNLYNKSSDVQHYPSGKHEQFAGWCQLPCPRRAAE